MAPVWWKLAKITLLLCALIATIVCIISVISNRRDNEAAAASSSNLLQEQRQQPQPQPQPRDDLQQHSPRRHFKRNDTSHQHQSGEVELNAEDFDDRLRSIFKVHDGEGVMLFNTTTSDDASFMPSIHTMLADQPASSESSWPQAHAPSQTQPRALKLEAQTQAQAKAEVKLKPKHYDQYQSLNHQQQSFKIQRSPDGKLNLIFNDPLISLQSTQHQQQQQQQQQQQHQPSSVSRTTPRRPPSDNKYRTSTPTSMPSVDSAGRQCVDGFNQSRSFCTKVSNYPDLSALKGVLERRFANFFSDEPQPTDVGLRINDDEQYLCNSHVRYLYPQLGQRLDLTWQYIVNTDEFKQGILIEECDHEGESCQFLDSFPNNYVPVCKQHYVIRHLATVNNATNGQPEVANEPFKIPSCCKCVIKSKFSSP